MKIILANPRGFCAGVNMAIESLDRNQIEAARDMGAPWWRIHWRVVIPFAKPGITSGCTRSSSAADHIDASVAIICSGTNGRPALEDVYVAGRLVAALGGVPSDAARVAERMASGYGSPREALAASEDAAQLRATGQERDIAWCARESVLEVVPEVRSIDDGAAVVAPARTTNRVQPMETAQEFA